MLVTPEGIVTLVRPLHNLKAESPIAVTGFPLMLAGIVIELGLGGNETSPVTVIVVPLSVKVKFPDVSANRLQLRQQHKTAKILQYARRLR